MPGDPLIKPLAPQTAKACAPCPSHDPRDIPGGQGGPQGSSVWCAGSHATALWSNARQLHISQGGFGGGWGCRGSPTDQSSWSEGCAAVGTPHRPPGVVEAPRVGAHCVWGLTWWRACSRCRSTRTARRAPTCGLRRVSDPKRPHRAAVTSGGGPPSCVAPWIQGHRQRRGLCTEVGAR